ncbi:restriction endonuclease subunit S [Roseovarius phycicola]|uniref:Restriction endonuclease subunit S n=1 Tax=Roseovarius phycicola TaxID=3080976 RepID=A0ABZ2HDU2_9RHOB
MSERENTTARAEKLIRSPRHFPGFNGKWDRKELRPYLVQHSERVPADTDLRIYSSSREGLLPQDEYYGGHNRLNEGEYGVVPDGYFVYRHMSDDTTFKFNINNTGQPVAVSKEYPVFKTDGVDPIFLRYLLNESRPFKQFAAGQRKGGTRTRLYFKALCSWRAPLPGRFEQERIAECLASVDALIEAEIEKLDALKDHKQGLMQQLFPAEGESLPTLRFPEFSGHGLWSETTLEAVIDLISGLHLSPADYSESGAVPYFTGPSDFTHNVEQVTKWTDNTANVANAGDILVTVKGSGVGELWDLALREVSLGRQLMAVRTHACETPFLFQFLQNRRSEFVAMASGNLIPGLSRSDILGMKLYLPQPEEQKAISRCLSSVALLISSQGSIVDGLKKHKQGLLQQLFPVLDEVDG